jgi:ubiquinone/menaquinone biosynthesis C-methylase UbiE
LCFCRFRVILEDMSLERVRATWETMGQEDPLWAVLSTDGMEGGAWDIEQFYALGERDVAQFLAEAQVLGAEPARGDALDFGCGVGRMTLALGSRFERVVGLDISAPMIELADKVVVPKAPNCTFVVSTEERLPFGDASFDFVLTNIVLQHMPPALAKGYIREFMRVLRPGAICVFQIPSEDLGRSESTIPGVARAMNALPSQWREELHRRRGGYDVRNLPMHGVPTNQVRKFVERNGGRVVACIDDVAAGPSWRSYHYVVRRDA